MISEQILSCPKQSSGVGLLHLVKKSMLFYSTMALFLLSIIALGVNKFIYQYPGNLYLPGNILLFLILPLMYVGFLILHGRDGKMTKMLKEFNYFFLMLILVMMATNAIQYTPFPTIDQSILKFEALFNIDMNAIITWTHAHSLFQSLLAWIYNSLPYQICYIPLIVIVVGKTHLIREFYFCLITSTLIGFAIYYFFPTTAPASVVNSLYFTDSQHATGLKFFQLHHYIQPDTNEGGLIALPSFHVIWAWLCLYLVRGWPVVFFTLLPINLLLTASCVLLGWHYCLDVVASVAVILCTHFLYEFTRKEGRD